MALAVPRIAAYTILFPEKDRLNKPLKAGVNKEGVITAIDAAISWWDAPEFFYQKENFIRAQAKSIPYETKEKHYAERINLIENGLVRGAIKPYKLARLARMHVLSGSNSLALAALQLSVDTGSNLHNLHMSRFITLYSLWPNISETERGDMRPLIFKAVNYDKRALIKFAKANSRARVMVREALKDNPAAFLQYVRDYLHF